MTDDIPDFEAFFSGPPLEDLPGWLRRLAVRHSPGAGPLTGVNLDFCERPGVSRIVFHYGDQDVTIAHALTPEEEAALT